MRRPRGDNEGTWHHVMNRGVARRAIFDDREDARMFLAGLAREVKGEGIEVHAWCLMTTHYHMLLRSRQAGMGEAMGTLQRDYSRYFNRRHRRDGPLVRGRYYSKVVEDLEYRETLLAYIDMNPVKAGIVQAPWEYPWCSARQLVTGKTPRWLCTRWVRDLVGPGTGDREVDVDSYRARYRDPDGLDRLLDDDQMIAATPERVRRLLARKAHVADGTAVAVPTVGVELVLGTLRTVERLRGPWLVSPRGRPVSAWPILEVGLLRQHAALPWRQIARLAGASLGAVTNRWEQHTLLSASDPEYAQTLKSIVQRAGR